MRKAYSPHFKAQVVRELLKEEFTVTQLATKYDVHPTQLHQWKATALKGLPTLFVDEHKALDATKAAYEQQLTTIAMSRSKAAHAGTINERRIYPSAHLVYTSTIPYTAARFPLGLISIHRYICMWVIMPTTSGFVDVWSAPPRHPAQFA
ncbi:MAG: transposase [Herpetosiphonaceae bacterium]|nr:transposase [Herpetosiphonaceae bacterium]